MCGINGILKFSEENILLESFVEKMNLQLGHRGPDDKGVWSHHRHFLSLGQTRLSILDLSNAGHQPMLSDDGKITVVFNGEIFNYKELNKTYLQHEKFRSHSDTETILKMYQHFGVKMFEKLNGMFSIVIWDENKQKLFLARDAAGKKPLYFSTMNAKFTFSSELKGLLHLPWIKKVLDDKVLYDFLTYNSVATPHTMFKDIEKFKPGYYMVVDKTGVKEYQPYQYLIKENLSFSSQKELEDMVYNQLEKSVKLRMISDVPVGASLSGGVDSSAIVALMRQHTSNEIKTFTIGFENQPNYNELDYAEKIAKKYNTNHFVKMVSPNDLLDFIPQITAIYDEPQADTTAIPIYFLSKLAKDENIKVMLNGDGPDELFSGYSNYEKYYKLHHLFNILQKSPGAIKRISNQLTHKVFPNHPLSEMTSRLVNQQDFYWPGAGGVKESVKNNLLSAHFKKKIAGHTSYKYVQELKQAYQTFLNGGKFDYINWLSFSGYKQAVTERFLFRADRLGMANSIESRSPFLDDDMIRLALSIPGKYKIKNGCNKFILKKSLERLLPNDVLYRKKMGFCLPIKEWAGSTIHDYVASNIDLFCKETAIFNASEVKLQLKALKQGKKEYTNNIWSIFFIIDWYKKWF